MAEILKEYFSSDFTIADISSLPVPITILRVINRIISRVVICNSRNDSKENQEDNKPPVVNGIPPKLLKEISTPLAKVFNLSLEEGIVHSEWKEANITLLI